MKPAIVWQLRDQAAFERALDLQFSRVPKKDEMIDGFRRRFVEGVERMASRTTFDPTAEHMVKYTSQQMGYSPRKPGEQGSPPGPVEEWLEVRYRFVDDGKTAEVVSVRSAKFDI